MLTNYSPQAIESKWYQYWESNHLFDSEFDSKNKKDSFCIMLPPPNVTGSLHMGHAFQHTIMDCLSRHQRMLGKKVLWQPGTDHAGIATQIVVEKQLQAKGITKDELGRAEFIKKVWEWKAQSGGTITSQMRRLGSSVDWSKEKFTLDDDMAKAVIKVFVELYKQGLIYQGTKLINWDPKLKTAISDLEVESKDEVGLMYYVNYPLIDEKTKSPSITEFLTIATTRPETILADGAIAFNPNDIRAKKYLKRLVRVPLTTRNIPVILDDYVDSEFGSGCVKITPAHDYNDYKVGERHEMEIINLFNDDSTMNANAPLAYQGLDRFEARKKIIHDLSEAGLLLKQVKHAYSRPYSERSGVVVEPYLSKQWFVKTETLAEKAKEVVANGEIRFIPENWVKTYFHWLNHIEDWCISRQLWWGHQIPAYYDEEGHVYVAESEEEAKKEAKAKTGRDVNLSQDPDVLDTWFSSALWPFSTLGWPQKTPEFKDYYPTSVLVTGFDIIFFWVARMVMFGCHFTKQIPFNEVYITGLIRDYDGQKMSKSKGNVIDPLDIIDGISIDELVAKRVSHLMKPKQAKSIEKKTRANFAKGIEVHGADALRFSFLSQASFGRNIRFDISRIAGYRNFCNKIFNAAKYNLTLIEKQKEGLAEFGLNPSTQLHPFDQWIISSLQRVEKTVANHLENYRLDMAAEAIYQFIWHEYCDWYLEMGKSILNSNIYSEEQKIATAQTTILIFETILRLLHPIMPFLTEELWQELKKALVDWDEKARFKPISISLCSYPKSEAKQIKPKIEAEVKYFQQVVLAIRQIRSEKQIPFKTALSVEFENVNAKQKKILVELAEPLQKIVNLQSVAWVDENDSEVSLNRTSAVVEGMKIHVIFSEQVDQTKELENLKDKINKTKTEIEFLEQKLSNASFCEKAPKALVDQHRERLMSAKLNLAKLNEQSTNLI